MEARSDTEGDLEQMWPMHVRKIDQSGHNDWLNPIFSRLDVQHPVRQGTKDAETH